MAPLTNNGRVVVSGVAVAKSKVSRGAVEAGRGEQGAWRVETTPRSKDEAKAKPNRGFYSLEWRSATTMDDAYPYELLVELEEGKHDAPRLKNKLLKHFQSKKRADGGECKIQHEDGSRTATLHFRRMEGDHFKLVFPKSFHFTVYKCAAKLGFVCPFSRRQGEGFG